MLKDVYKLTNPQKNIWQVEQVTQKESSINHILTIMKLKGNLDERILSQTINKVIEVNDSFRIRFIKKEGELYQYIEEYSYTPIEFIHLDKDDITELIEKHKNEKITLDKLFNFSVVITPNFTFIIYKTHHIIADAWGMTQVAEQIKEIYSLLLENKDLSEYKKPSYRTLIEREKEYLQSKKYNIDLNFWGEYIKNIIPSKIFSNLNNFDIKAKRFEYTLNDELFEKISKLCLKNSITEYSFFLAIIAIYFNKIFNQDSIVIGTPFLNRQKRVGELESTGLYVSTLPLNIDVAGETDFITLCKKINSLNISLYKHSGFSYYEIQKMYNKYANNTEKIYDIGFSYQINKLTNQTSSNDSGECTWVFLEEQNQPLTIHLSSVNNHKVLFYDYLVSCFSEEGMKKTNEIILNLIYQVLDENIYDISNLATLTLEDIKKLKTFNNTGNVKRENLSIIDILENIVNSHSDNIAIICGEEKITYKEFYKKVTILANYLNSKGITNNSPVVLFFDKSIEMIISMFAILKAGGCYVPVLPNENLDRIKYILNDCKPKCIITHKEYDINISYDCEIINIDKIDLSKIEVKYYNKKIDADNLAYIIYTSGSTGNPKGTMLTHKNVCGLKTSIENDSVLQATDKDVSMSLLKYSFDASGIDIYTALLFGGKLVLVEKEDELNPKKVVEIIKKHKISRSFLIPKWIEHLAIQSEAPETDLSTLRILGTGGEILKPYVIKNLLQKYPKLNILNLYGPTETTMFTTYKVVGNNEVEKNHTSIGKPIFGSRIAIINKYGDLMPIETTGELIVYEDKNSIYNIAKGYLNLPEQTQDKFIEIYNPVLKEKVRAYKTGDIAKIDNLFEIEFIGRRDDIVKINGGYLVALNEVEKKISKLLGNNFETYPIAVPFQNTKIIVLFIKSKNISISLNNVKKYIDNNISFYMRPKKIIEIGEFPRNSSGKIDRKKLKEIAEKQLLESKGEIISPETETEKEIYEIIKKFVDTDMVSVTDDFIDDLGLDSLTLTSIYTALENYKINIQDLYNNPNIRDLATFIDGTSTNIEITPNLELLQEANILNNVKKFDLSTVLITGVTGFLGIHLLNDLLLEKDVKKVYCMIRDKINLPAQKRLEKMISYYFNSNNQIKKLIEEKVIVINGDTTKEFLGLNPNMYKLLEKEVTTVLNSAANVKHFAKPEQIREDNVTSVNNLIEFCGSSKSLAHISTLSIAGFSSEDTHEKTFDENAFYIGQKFNNNPYLVSKFEAEKNILIATGKNRLNAIIFRLGNIMPRHSDGLFQANFSQNVFLSALKAILDTGMISAEFNNLKIEFSPVDECSKFIIKLMTLGESQSVYHVLNNKEITIMDFRKLVKKMNYNIKDVDFETFKKELIKHCDEYTKEYILSNNLNKYSQDITQKFLHKMNLEWSNLDYDYLKEIINIIRKF